MFHRVCSDFEPDAPVCKGNSPNANNNHHNNGPSASNNNEMRNTKVSANANAKDRV